jgi:hypothetical protein
MKLTTLMETNLPAILTIAEDAEHHSAGTLSWHGQSQLNS